MADELRALTRLTFEELGLATGGIGDDPPRDRRPRVRAGRLGPAADAPRRDLRRRLRRPARRCGAGRARRRRRGLRPRPFAVGDAARGRGPRRPERAARRRARGRGHRISRSRCASASAATRARPPTCPAPGRASSCSCTGCSRPSTRGATTRTARACSATSASRRSTCASTPAATSPRTAARSPSCWTRSSRTGRSTVEQIALVGHSMGGLVARSACHHGGDWTPLVRHTVSLGSPHTGAPLESAVHYAATALGVVGGDAPVRRLPAPPQRRHPRPALAARWSTRTGADATPRPCAPRRAGRSRCSRAPPTTSSPPRSPTSAEHPVGRLVGDWLVLPAERLRPQPDARDRLRRRERRARRRDQPPGAAQPPGGVRAPARVACASASSRSASHGTAASCSGFMRTLRSTRAPSASISR